MALNVLFIGGTGQISLPCVHEAVAAGHKVSVLNRGKTNVDLPAGVSIIVGDMDDAATYGQLGDGKYDVVCQFRAYRPEQMKKDIATFTGKTGQYIFISSASAYQKPAQALHHHRADAAGKSLLGVQPRQDRLRDHAARAVRAAVDDRAAEPHGAHRHAAGHRRRRRGRPAAAARRAGDRARRRHVAVDGDPLRRFRRALRQAVRQSEGDRRRLPDHQRPRPSPGTRSPTASPTVSASRRTSSTCRPTRWCATTRPGKGR